MRPPTRYIVTSRPKLTTIARISWFTGFRKIERGKRGGHYQALRNHASRTAANRRGIPWLIALLKFLHHDKCRMQTLVNDHEVTMLGNTEMR